MNCLDESGPVIPVRQHVIGDGSVEPRPVKTPFVGGRVAEAFAPVWRVPKTGVILGLVLESKRNQGIRCPEHRMS